MKLRLASIIASLILVLLPAKIIRAQATTPTITGRWQIEFTLAATTHRLQFDAQETGEGKFLSLDPVSATGVAPAETNASWTLRGLSPAIYVFVITGDAELSTAAGGIEKGKLELNASSDLTLPIKSLRGWGQFHSSSRPNDGRGSEDPIFDFTATRIEKFSVRVTSPVAGVKLRRGREVAIDWMVESALPISSQEVLLSLDGGDTFISVALALAGDVREFAWTLPENLPKTKRALIKVVATDNSGNNAEGLTTGTLRIK